MGWVTHSVLAENTCSPFGCWYGIVWNGQNLIVLQPIWTSMQLGKQWANEECYIESHWMVSAHRCVVNGCCSVENKCSWERGVSCCDLYVRWFLDVFVHFDSLTRTNIMSSSFFIIWLRTIFLPTLLNARYDAYVTSDGTNNPSCNQSAPCGLFQYVIENIESTNIANDDLYIHINGSNPPIFLVGTDGTSYCEMTLTGNITFIMDPNTVTTASDWFGSSILSGCDYESILRPIDSNWFSTYNLLTVAEGADVVFYDLVWDHYMPFLQSLDGSTFHCERCLIQNINADDTTFLLANTATFRDCIFRNISVESVFELFPITELESNPSFEAPQSNSELILSGCSLSDIASSAFIGISASSGMLRDEMFSD